MTIVDKRSRGTKISNSMSKLTLGKGRLHARNAGNRSYALVIVACIQLSVSLVGNPICVRIVEKSSSHSKILKPIMSRIPAKSLSNVKSVVKHLFAQINFECISVVLTLVASLTNACCVGKSSCVSGILKFTIDVTLMRKGRLYVGRVENRLLARIIFVCIQLASTISENRSSVRFVAKFSCGAKISKYTIDPTPAGGRPKVAAKLLPTQQRKHRQRKLARPPRGLTTRERMFAMSAGRFVAGTVTWFNIGDYTPARSSWPAMSVEKSLLFLAS